MFLYKIIYVAKTCQRIHFYVKFMYKSVILHSSTYTDMLWF